MKRKIALRHARLVAQVILGGVENFKSMEEFPPCVRSAVWKKLQRLQQMERRDFYEFREILIFGSVARGEAEVGDVDMILLDDDFYSCAFFEEKGEFDEEGYSVLRHNLPKLLMQWFGYQEDSYAVRAAMRQRVDLHVLPVGILWDRSLQNKWLQHHWDKDFFDHAFSRLMRFDQVTGEFCLTSRAQLCALNPPPQEDVFLHH
ncbi:MAG: hypothetical protein RL141_6 [Candidatus Parcubacteria bacterium]|jgi:hypothetical protein